MAGPARYSTVVTGHLSDDSILQSLIQNLKRMTRSHLLAVLRCLADSNLALTFGSPSLSVSPSLRAYIQNVGCSDAYWAC